MSVTEIDKFLLETISVVDGAMVIDGHMNIVSFGEIIEMPNNVVYKDTFGTGTKAARYASNLGIAIKISEDGDIYILVTKNCCWKYSEMSRMVPATVIGKYVNEWDSIWYWIET